MAAQVSASAVDRKSHDRQQSARPTQHPDRTLEIIGLSLSCKGIVTADEVGTLGRDEVPDTALHMWAPYPRGRDESA